MKRPKPRLYRGFRDIFSADLNRRRQMLDAIRKVYESYGFVPLETPAVEYVDVLGKFLPESDQPDGGIFAFRNEDEDWIALRYDLTASLSRVVAQYRELQRPFRRYQVGPVYRFEKPGPDHFREFYQFDFDTVGAPGMETDAESCIVLADALEAVGIDRGKYVIKVNNRKVLNALLDQCGIGSIDQDQDDSLGLNVLRCIDKYDRVGLDGVKELLTTGRKDQSGDIMPGLNLQSSQVDQILKYLSISTDSRKEVVNQLEELITGGGKTTTPENLSGTIELIEMDSFLTSMGYDQDQIIFDPTVVRGLGYYTGPVYEATLTFDVVDEKGRMRTFGSIGGGGRYDDLVKRFTGQQVPATGASIGVDRLLAAMSMLGQVDGKTSTVDVLVTVMDRSYLTEYHKFAQELRAEGINTEVYARGGNIGRQMKYADKCGIPLVVIAGEDEFKTGEVQIKDLALGSELSKDVSDRETWRKDRPAQFAVNRERMVAAIKERLGAI